MVLTVAAGANGPPRCAPVLTARQMEMIPLIARELSNEEIARTLGISAQTVKNHMSLLMGRLGCQTRVGVIVWAYEHGRLPLAAHPG